MNCSPVQLTKREAADITPETASAVRRLDCSMYNICLDTAEKGDWPSFGCKGCQAYQAMDIEQRVYDLIGLRACDEAAENVDRTTAFVEKDGRQVRKIGKADRRRGVKPGADAKTRLRVIEDLA